jgi:pimeloyl-ACP methyl ester carboxylesterase
VIALLLAAGIVGGRVYAARFEVLGAHVAVWRYAAAGQRSGPPVVLFGELGFDHRALHPLASALQARGREVFVPDWRGTGQSSEGPAFLGGLDSLLLGDARAALEAALRETGAPCAQLVGLGLGGAAVYLLASRACAVVGISVPARWEVPNEAARRLIAALRALSFPEEWADLSGWLAAPSPLDRRERKDLGALFLGLAPGASLRRAAGRIAPQLARDVLSWMEGGDFAQRVSAAADALRVPLLVVTAPRDNWVHPEHAFALRAPHDQIVLSRLEGFGEEHAHLPLPHDLFPEIAAWLDSH